MDRVLLRPLQLWDWRRPNSTLIPTDTRWRASPYCTRRGGSSSQSAEDGKVSRRGLHTSRISPSRRRSYDWHPDLKLQLDLEDRRMADHMDSITSYHTPKERQLQLCQNYRIISLISHPSKAMLKIILNRLQPQAEDIIALHKNKQVSEPKGAPQNKYSVADNFLQYSDLKRSVLAGKKIKFAL